MGRKKRQHRGLLAVGIAVVSAVAVFCGGAYWIEAKQQQERKATLEVNTIYPGVTVEGVDVGGMTKSEAFSALERVLNDPMEQQQVTFVYGEESWQISLGEMGAQYGIEDAVRQAYALGRQEDQSEQERYEQVRSMRETGQDVSAEITYDPEQVRMKVEEVTKNLEKEPQNATMTRENGVFLINGGEDGFTVHSEEAIAQTEALVAQGTGGTVVLTGENVAPEISRQVLEESQDLLGQFSTAYSGNDSLGRNINLIVGCEKINGTLLLPGETFSMNAGLGDQTYENGFRDAAIIVNGKIEDGIAGGVCQVTTTLYNAVVKAELTVVERSNHSLPVSYVPLGHDAAIAGDYIDFKFRNDTDHPVYLEAYAGGGQVVAKLYGHETRDPSRTVELEAEVNETIPKPAEKITEDPEKPEGEREVTYTGKVGYRVTTYKVVKENGQIISREVFNHSTYKATADEVTVGTKKEETAQPQDQNQGGQMGQSIISG